MDIAEYKNVLKSWETQSASQRDAETFARGFAQGAPTHLESIDIEASPKAIYDLITRVDAYAEWNPFVLQAKGLVEPGQVIKTKVDLGIMKLNVGYEVLSAVPHVRFAWCDAGPMFAMSRGHRFRFIQPTAKGCRLVQRITIIGPLAGLAWSMFGAGLKAGIAAENAAIARRASAK